MISITNAILIQLFHLIADFFLQTRQMGENKSKSVKWLSLHVLVYSIATSLFWTFAFFKEITLYNFLSVFLYTFISHFITDFITSKISGIFYIRSIGKNIKWIRDTFGTEIVEEFDKDEVPESHRQSNMARFWNTIGSDQFIHATTLLLTYKILLT